VNSSPGRTRSRTEHNLAFRHAAETAAVAARTPFEAGTPPQTRMVAGVCHGLLFHLAEPKAMLMASARGRGAPCAYESPAAAWKRALLRPVLATGSCCLPRLPDVDSKIRPKARPMTSIAAPAGAVNELLADRPTVESGPGVPAQSRRSLSGSSS